MASTKMLRTQNLLCLIAILLQFVYGLEAQQHSRRYRENEVDDYGKEYYDMIIPDLEEALMKMEELLIKAESDNDDEAFENLLEMLHNLVEYTRNSNNAYKFVKAKGIDRIIPQHLKSSNNDVKTRTLIFLKSLFDIAPTTMSASMPIVIVDRILDIFEKGNLALKAHALDVLEYWLPENPRVQARVMKIKGLVPFYDQVDKLDMRVIATLLNLFNIILKEHITVRSESQKHLVDNDKMKFYLRIGLLEHMSSDTICGGLMNIFTKLWSYSTNEHGVMVVVFDLMKNIKPYCLKSYQSDEKAQKLFSALSEFVNDQGNKEFFDMYEQNMTDVALVIGEYVEKLKYNVKDEM
ncbi:hypothetical protein HF086_008199 [Spodoptera exigua]|uniref:Uncharacterized protein n=1 Tax=Spodoptera exigua TaxID=7107 RepID=A0A922M4B8_SPOEX|nr:hypothetical protein HF086_008199 [Spodoptera exigua]